MILSYRENGTASDLQYTVRGSADLVQWTDLIPNGNTIIKEIAHPDPDRDGSARQIRFRQKISAEDPLRFLSLFARTF